VKEHQHLPDIDRFSVIMASILIAYSLTAVISFPRQSVNIQLPGFLLAVDINLLTIVSLIVAVMAAAGCEWLINEHPFLEKSTRWYHWLIPAMTALVIGVPLDVLQVSTAWWGVFALGGILLGAVLLSEYISVDPSDIRSPLAIISLTAVSLGLFLTLVIALRGSGERLYLILAAIAPASFLVAARCLILRSADTWKPVWALGIAIVVTELAAGLYYLPLLPIQFGLILLGVLFALITLAGNIEESRSSFRLWMEPAFLLLVFSVSGLFFFN
jgi:hypothetical protein